MQIHPSITRHSLTAILLTLATSHCGPTPATQDASVDSTAVDASPSTDAAEDTVDSSTEAGPSETPTMARVSSGELVGATREGVRRFLGIPYAAAPTGPRRWRAPEPASAWATPRMATQHGPSCPQSPARDPLSGQTFATSEDCLTLNVWTPEAPSATPRPVMVFVHGGGFVSGTGSLSLYDGANLARSAGAVVVTLNYRLGQLGFLAHSALRAEQTSNAGPGNYGLLDQQAALRWVRDEVRALGGDPANVTLFGESAGSLSVCLHMVAPGSRGLFHRAIGQSASCTFFVNTLSTTPDARFQPAESLGSLFSTALRCESRATPAEVLACLRSKSVDEVLMAEPRPAELNIRDARYQPSVDGVVLPMRPWAMFRAGMSANVPFMSGTNRDEGTVFSLTTSIANETEYRAAVRALLPLRDTVLNAALNDILTRYWPIAMYPSAKDAYNAFLGDVAFVCPARAQARMMASRAMAQPVWLYHFTRENLGGRNLGLGVFHSAELPYVFANFVRPFMRTPMDATVSDLVVGAWARFARTGDPNGAGLAPAWPSYSMTNDSLYVLDVTPRTENAFRQQKCDAIDTWLMDLDSPVMAGAGG
ncbi:MAG: carboxylesterase/lipase family protein [Deltaproteobacteria bacterium]|nr:carboxylesterase/lipase family protein [Deltaproteobacteria bacterium]